MEYWLALLVALVATAILIAGIVFSRQQQRTPVGRLLPAHGLFITVLTTFLVTLCVLSLKHSGQERTIALSGAAVAAIALGVLLGDVRAGRRIATHARTQEEAATRHGALAGSPSSDQDPIRRARSALAGATSIIIVPGYGMELARSHHEVCALARKLSQAGKLVRFAIHPDAGRAPGLMQALLAEAGVEKGDMYEMDAINDDFASTDVAIVVGACDVVNPAAITTPDTLISGMPILRVHEAGTIIICNLDDHPGCSGIPNPLYDDPKAIPLFGDAKETVALLAGCRAE